MLARAFVHSCIAVTWQFNQLWPTPIALCLLHIYVVCSHTEYHTIVVVEADATDQITYSIRQCTSIDLQLQNKYTSDWVRSLVHCYRLFAINADNTNAIQRKCRICKNLQCKNVVSKRTERECSAVWGRKTKNKKKEEWLLSSSAFFFNVCFAPSEQTMHSNFILRSVLFQMNCDHCVCVCCVQSAFEKNELKHFPFESKRMKRKKKYWNKIIMLRLILLDFYTYLRQWRAEQKQNLKSPMQCVSHSHNEWMHSILLCNALRLRKQ